VKNAEVARLRQWIADLQSGMYVNCVYCGHRYGPDPGTPVAMADVLKAHIEVCPEHPASQLKAQVAELRAALLSAIETIHTWHGMQFVGRSKDDPNRHLDKKLWEIYRTQAPEMKLLNEALAKTSHSQKQTGGTK
jgi:hypothetical protein